MSFRIERPQRLISARPGAKAETERRGSSDGASKLPVPVGPATSVPRPDNLDAESAYAAQLMGQDGQKRGLRGGQPVLDAARETYSSVEWSGAQDRRRRQGRIAKTVA